MKDFQQNIGRVVGTLALAASGLFLTPEANAHHGYNDNRSNDNRNYVRGRELGGLVLDDYCRHLGYRESSVKREGYFPNAAYNNWICEGPGRRWRDIDMLDAGAWQYDKWDIEVRPKDPNNYFTWTVYQRSR